MAVQLGTQAALDVQRNPALCPSLVLNITWHKTLGDVDQALDAVQQCRAEHGSSLVAVIGPAYSSEAVVLAPYGSRVGSVVNCLQIATCMQMWFRAQCQG